MSETWDFGYVGRVPGCGCVVLITVDRQRDSLADTIGDAIRDGLYIERHPTEAIRSFRLGTCTHGEGPKPPMRGGREMFRAECVCYVSVPVGNERLAP